MLPVEDPERAGRFYVDVLGLRPAEKGAQSKRTALSFEVPDLEAEIRELEDRGVRFEDYDLHEVAG